MQQNTVCKPLTMRVILNAGSGFAFPIEDPLRQHRCGPSWAKYRVDRNGYRPAVEAQMVAN